MVHWTSILYVIYPYYAHNACTAYTHNTRKSLKFTQNHQNSMKIPRGDPYGSSGNIASHEKRIYYLCFSIDLQCSHSSRKGPPLVFSLIFDDFQWFLYGFLCYAYMLCTHYMHNMCILRILSMCGVMFICKTSYMYVCMHFIDFT